MAVKERQKLNRQARITTVFFTLIFCFMIGYYAYYLVEDSQSVANNSYNKRIDSQANQVIRGTVFSSDGKELAYTDTNGTESDFSDDTRVYPYGKSFAHAIGITTHGKSGVEKLCNYDLLSAQSSAMQKIIDDFTQTKQKGCDVYTTFDASLQKKSYQTLGDHKGSVFIMDPTSGAVYTMTSRPSYNPETIDDIWDELSEDSSDSRLVNRATQGKYIPGSIFKIVTTLSYMRDNNKYNKFSYDCYGKAKFKGFSIACFNNNAHYSENLTDAFAYSCNSAFSTIGTKLDMNIFSKTANDLLFNSELPLEMEYNKSQFVLNNESSQFDIAQTSIGQGETTVSPAHMAMLASAIANDGILMKPYIVDSVVDGNGATVRTTKATEYKKLMTEEEAKQLKKYMRAVCEYGTGKIMAYSDYKAYGKTGTAELDKQDKINSWFIGFAKKGDKCIAIAVVLEDINQGDDSAVNCAKKIFDSYFD